MPVFNNDCAFLASTLGGLPWISRFILFLQEATILESHGIDVQSPGGHSNSDDIDGNDFSEQVARSSKSETGPRSGTVANPWPTSVLYMLLGLFNISLHLELPKSRLLNKGNEHFPWTRATNRASGLFLDSSLTTRLAWYKQPSAAAFPLNSQHPEDIDRKNIPLRALTRQWMLCTNHPSHSGSRARGFTEDCLFWAFFPPQT